MTEDIAALYALPLEEFTAARNALAKSVRARGDAEHAKAIAALKKPTAPAWAIDQAARANPVTIDRLLAAGDALREAQRALLRGGDPNDLHTATTAERELVAELTAAAAAFLPSDTLAFRERIADTLSAIAIDPELHDQLRAGMLVEEHRRVGFGEIPDLKLVPPLADVKTKAAERAEEKRKEEERRRADAEARASRLRAEADALEADAGELEGKAARARRKAATLREQADAALRTH